MFDNLFTISLPAILVSFIIGGEDQRMGSILLNDQFSHNFIFIVSDRYDYNDNSGNIYIILGVAIRIRNPNPTPFLDKKHNPNPYPNPQVKLRIRIVVFLKLCSIFKKKSTYKILIIINNLICCKFFSNAGNHRKFTSKSKQIKA